MTKVTADEVGKRLAGGQRVTVVDSRAPDAWKDSKIKAGGAVRIPPEEAEKHIADVSRDDYVVTYCT
jgi:rhodanese-related sulfurtransferase